MSQLPSDRETKLGADFPPYVSIRASRSLHGRREGCLRMPTAGTRDPLEAQIARAHDEVVLKEWVPSCARCPPCRNLSRAIRAKRSAVHMKDSRCGFALTMCSTCS